MRIKVTMFFDPNKLLTVYTSQCPHCRTHISIGVPYGGWRVRPNRKDFRKQVAQHIASCSKVDSFDYSGVGQE